MTVNAEGAEPLTGASLSHGVGLNVEKRPEPVTFSVCATAGPPDCAEKLSGFLSTPNVCAWSAVVAQKSEAKNTFFKRNLQNNMRIKSGTWQSEQEG